MLRRRHSPSQFANHPAILMTVVLRQRRQLVRRELHRERLQLRMQHYAIGAALEEFGSLSQKEVSEHLAMDPSDIVPLIDHMEQDGLLLRVRDEQDRRRYSLNLTEEGHKLIQAMNKRFGGSQDNFLSPLTPKERQQFITLLRKLLR
jgi:DNA-binding MarR family transcriptional regulator